MKKVLISLVLLLSTALGSAPDADAGRQRFKVKQDQAEPRGAHRTGAGERTRNKHEDANARREREQAAKLGRQQDASKAKTRRQQAAKQIAAGNKKKQRGN